MMFIIDLGTLYSWKYEKLQFVRPQGDIVMFMVI